MNANNDINKKNVKNVVYKYISDATGLHNFNGNDVLGDLGMDSLDTLEMLMEMEKEYCIDAVDTRTQTIRTVNDVIRVVEAAIENVDPTLYELRAKQEKNTSLYTIKQGKPYCRVSEEICKKIQPGKITNNGTSPCEQVNCIIVKNMKKMLAEMQKTK